jgi:hypothetical protein
MRQLLTLLFVIVCYTHAFSASTVVLKKQVVADDSVSQRDGVVGEKLRDLPSVLQQIADERREFQVNLGKAMDTLRKDMPEILKRAPGKFHKQPLS